MLHGRKGVLIVASATAAVAGSVGFALTASAAAPQSPHSAASAAVASGPFAAKDAPGLAKRVAAHFGGGVPGTVQYTTGTREALNLAMSGDDIPDQTPSYLIVMRGKFSSGPPTYPGEPASAQHPDNWSVEMLVVDAATGQVTDSGGSDAYPNLASLAPVHTVTSP